VEELVAYIAKALVNRPDEVRVTRVEGTAAVVLELRVAPTDMGKVIGKDGRIVAAIRTLVHIVAARAGKRVTLVIL
jgi:predicted RNA-binding protein YlqC (UPF0109 family)